MRIKKRYSRKLIKKGRKVSSKRRSKASSRKNSKASSKRRSKASAKRRKVSSKRGGAWWSRSKSKPNTEPKKLFYSRKIFKDMRVSVAHEPVRYVIPFVYKGRAFLMFFKYNNKDVKSKIVLGQPLEYKGLMLLNSENDLDISVIKTDIPGAYNTNPGNPINKLSKSSQFELKCEFKAFNCKIKKRQGDILIKNFKWISNQCNNNVIDYGGSHQAKGGLEDKEVLFSRPDGKEWVNNDTQKEGMGHKAIIDYLKTNIKTVINPTYPINPTVHHNSLIQSLKLSLIYSKNTIDIHLKKLGFTLEEDILSNILGFEQSFLQLYPLSSNRSGVDPESTNPSVYFSTCFTLAKFPMWCESVSSKQLEEMGKTN